MVNTRVAFFEGAPAPPKAASQPPLSRVFVDCPRVRLARSATILEG